MSQMVKPKDKPLRINELCEDPIYSAIARTISFHSFHRIFHISSAADLSIFLFQGYMLCDLFNKNKIKNKNKIT